jgi:small subunit ribosomal protein S6e
MAFKINISNNDGKTYKVELESEALIGKELGEKINGKDIVPSMEGYELVITGASDKAGFTSHEQVEGVGLKKLLLSYEKGMHKRPKHEGKKKRSNTRPRGLRLRKTVRGKVISPEIIQINTKIVKAGTKPLSEVFPDQNKAPEPEKTAQEPKAEAKPEASKEEPKAEEKKEETKTQEKDKDKKE